jgi:hypothetical protein
MRNTNTLEPSNFQTEIIVGQGEALFNFQIRLGDDRRGGAPARALSWLARHQDSNKRGHMGLPLDNRGDAKTQRETGIRFSIFALIKRVRIWLR